MRRGAQLTFAAAAALLSWAGPASAFCRATTCDPNDPAEDCPTDKDGCLTTGLPLAWRSSCVTVGVQKMGSPRSGFSYDDVVSVVETAFGAWLDASCTGGKPSIDVQMIGPIECGLSEYNQKAGNANVVLFREDDWPHHGAGTAIGLTTTRFDTRTGELWDADIELNAVTGDLSLGDPITGSDLLSVLTHEAGHFLGLAHSPDQSATMKTIYSAEQDGSNFRSLEQDDVDGICSIYPPDRKIATTSCVNRHGFSAQCGADQEPTESEGCSLNTRAVGARSDGGGGATDYGVLTMLAAMCGLRLARRRRVV